MQVLIVGYGSAGKRHAHNARLLGHEVVVWDDSGRARRAAIDDGFPLADFDPCWLAEKGAAIIATPAATHHDVARQLLDAGYSGPLFVEKPIDVTTEHAEFWRSWPHPTAMVGYNWRFVEGVKEAAGGEIGVTVTCTNMDDWPGFGYAGDLLECSHDIDLHLFLFPQENIEVVRGQEPATWYIRHGGNARGGIYSRAASPTSRYFGVDADVVYKFFTPDEIAAAVEPSYRAELAAFLAAAEKGEPVPEAATFADGLAVVEIVEQAEAMA